MHPQAPLRCQSDDQLYIFKAFDDICHPLECPCLMKEAAAGESGSGGAGSGRGPRPASASSLPSISCCTKLGSLWARNREGPRQSELSSLDEHSVPYRHVKKTRGGSSIHGGQSRKGEMGQAGEDGHASGAGPACMVGRELGWVSSLPSES